MENRYEKYLPDTVSELQEFRKLAEIEGEILEETAMAKDELVDNQWILTARRSGLLRLAKMMGFLGAEMLETEALREEILYRWCSRSPYTYFHLQDWLESERKKGFSAGTSAEHPSCESGAESGSEYKYPWRSERNTLWAAERTAVDPWADTI